MLWKSVTALILLFWSVMTIMLVRQTYFPEGGAAVETSVPAVLERVARCRQPSRSTLQLIREQAKLGHADFSITEWREGEGTPRKGFTWQAGGMIDAQVNPEAGVTAWRFEGDVMEDLSWERINISVRATGTDTNLFLTWKRGDEMPKIEVRRGGNLIMDTAGVLEQAKKQPGIQGGLALMMPGFLGKQKLSLEHSIHLKAHSGPMMLAGKARKGYSLTISLLSLYQAKAHFTEAGELARVEMPQSLKLIDPLLEGLEK